MTKITSAVLCLSSVLFATSAHSDWFGSDLFGGGSFGGKWFGDDETQYPSTEVSDAYIDLHTGPGRGYPVLQSVERGGVLEVMKRRTDWFLVRTERGDEGWVHRTQLIRTVDSSGQPVTIANFGREAFSKRTVEVGLMAGRFEGANAVGVHADFFMTPSFAIEGSYTEALGNISDNQHATFGVQHYFKPEWRVSPYVGVGVGSLSVTPNAALAASEDRRDATRYAQAGIAVHVKERFMFRLDYRHNNILTNRDNNEEIDEWKAGFAVFY